MPPIGEKLTDLPKPEIILLTEKEVEQKDRILAKEREIGQRTEAVMPEEKPKFFEKRHQRSAIAAYFPNETEELIMHAWIDRVKSSGTSANPYYLLVTQAFNKVTIADSNVLVPITGPLVRASVYKSEHYAPIYSVCINAAPERDLTPYTDYSCDPDDMVTSERIESAYDNIMETIEFIKEAQTAISTGIVAVSSTNL